MSQKQAISLIEEGLSNPNCTSAENAKKISALIYKTFPDLDENFSLATYMDIVHVENGITVEYCNLSCAFAFECRDDGSIKYSQFVRGNDDHSWWEDIYEQFPSDSEIIKNIKRKRLQRK